MRGHAEHNYPLFEMHAKALRKEGYEIVSPHEINRQGTSRRQCMIADVMSLLRCDAVLCLPGWELSPGASVEVVFAWSADMPVYQLVPGDRSGHYEIYLLDATTVHIPRERQWYEKIPLIGLCGYAQSGKDTVAGHLVKTHDWSRVAFADALREMLYALDPIVDTSINPIYEFGVDEPHMLIIEERLREIVDVTSWDDAKTTVPEVRELLQRLGTEAGRTILGEHTWVSLGEEKIEEAVPRPVVVSDCRFPNEVAMIRRRGGTLAWIDRPGTKAVNAHASEHSVTAEDCHTIISNDGTLDDLFTQVDLLVVNFNWDPTVWTEEMKKVAA